MAMGWWYIGMGDTGVIIAMACWCWYVMGGGGWLIGGVHVGGCVMIVWHICCRLVSCPCKLLIVSVWVRTRSSVAAYALPKVLIEDSRADVRDAVVVSSLISWMFMP